MHAVVEFVRRVCAKYGLRAIYVSDVKNTGGMRNDFFSITTKQGHVVMNFTTRVFYHIPPRLRERQIEITLRRTLNRLMGERSIRNSQRTIIPRKYGKQIA